jgi:hypothetical protein
VPYIAAEDDTVPDCRQSLFDVVRSTDEADDDMSEAADISDEEDISGEEDISEDEDISDDDGIADDDDISDDAPPSAELA